MSDTFIVGLGNPGSEYEGTRHNTGFAVLDELALRWKQGFKPGKGEFLYLRKHLRGNGVTLVKPLTYMNNSGIAVREILALSGGTVQDLLVVVDDVALPLGVLRMRPGGSDGGHNGLGSIIAELGTEGFGRLRCGVGRETLQAEGLTVFVLSPFDTDERELAGRMIARAADAIETFIIDGMSRTMSLFNTLP